MQKGSLAHLKGNDNACCLSLFSTVPLTPSIHPTVILIFTEVLGNSIWNVQGDSKMMQVSLFFLFAKTGPFSSMGCLVVEQEGLPVAHGLATISAAV